MLPSGHLAGGALAGALLAARQDDLPPAVVIIGTALAANAPDLDVLIPHLLSGFGLKHQLASGDHHRWATHAPIFWTALMAALAHHQRAAAPADRTLVRMLTLGVTVHLLQDATVNSVMFLWP